MTQATMKDVIEEANISRGGLYAYFNNIEDLFLAVLIQDDRLNEQALLAFENEKSASKKLKNWINQLLTALDIPGRNLTRAKSEFFLRFTATQVPYLAERRVVLQKRLVDFIAEGIKKKEFRSDINVPCFTDILVASVNGLMLSESGDVSTEEERSNKIDMLTDMLINYLI